MNKTFSKKNILVIEDDKLLRDKRKLIIEKFGYHCKTAKDGIEALLQISQDSFDLIITGINMKKMDFIEFLREVKKHYPVIDVLVITGNGEGNILLEIIKEGASVLSQQYLYKVFRF